VLSMLFAVGRGPAHGGLGHHPAAEPGQHRVPVQRVLLRTSSVRGMLHFLELTYKPSS